MHEGSFSSYSLATEVDKIFNLAVNISGILLDEASNTVLFADILSNSVVGKIKLDGSGYTITPIDPNKLDFDSTEAPQQTASIQGTYYIILRTTPGFGNTYQFLRIYKKGVLLQTLDFSSKFTSGPNPWYAISPSGQYIVAIGGDQNAQPVTSGVFSQLDILVYRGS